MGVSGLSECLNSTDWAEGELKVVRTEIGLLGTFDTNVFCFP